MSTTELTYLIKSRRSVRAYQNKEVSEDLLLQAVELATYAPNAGNQQNWRFYIILKPETIKAIADTFQNISVLMASWPEAAQVDEKIISMAEKRNFLYSSPSLIAVATSQYQSGVDRLLELRGKTDPKAAQIREWRSSADSKVQSVASGVAYLLLIVHQMGLGAVWMTGPMQSKGEIEKILKVPAGMDLAALVSIGYPAENPPLRERKPVKEVCEVIK
jgi:coenzyme F420-0:L-glutamate ligase/coenzyme F420-1:gamma-L-glutamate ligase